MALDNQLEVVYIDDRPCFLTHDHRINVHATFGREMSLYYVCKRSDNGDPESLVLIPLDRDGYTAVPLTPNNRYRVLSAYSGSLEAVKNSMHIQRLTQQIVSLRRQVTQLHHDLHTFKLQTQSSLLVLLLPEETLLHILSFLDNPLDLIHMARVNKLFNRLVGDESLWKNLFIQRSKLPVKNPSLATCPPLDSWRKEVFALFHRKFRTDLFADLAQHLSLVIQSDNEWRAAYLVDYKSPRVAFASAVIFVHLPPRFYFAPATVLVLPLESEKSAKLPSVPRSIDPAVYKTVSGTKLINMRNVEAFIESACIAMASSDTNVTDHVQTMSLAELEAHQHTIPVAPYAESTSEPAECLLFVIDLHVQELEGVFGSAAAAFMKLCRRTKEIALVKWLCNPAARFGLAVLSEGVVLVTPLLCPLTAFFAAVDMLEYRPGLPPPCDLSQLPEAIAQILTHMSDSVYFSNKSLLRVLLLYNRSSVVPIWRNPAAERSFEQLFKDNAERLYFDVSYWHERPGRTNSPQDVYDMLTELGKRSDDNHYYYEHRGRYRLVQNMNMLLIHPKRRPLNQLNWTADIPLLGPRVPVSGAFSAPSFTK